MYPLIDLLERVMLRFDREESPQQKLRKLEGHLVQYGLPLTEVVPLLAALLSIPLTTNYAPLSLSPEQQKQQTLHALLTILLHIASQQPLLFVMEDLHWVDPSTLEFLSLLVDQGPTARELGEYLLTLAQRQSDPVLLLAVPAALGGALFFRGEAAAAHVHLARGSALDVTASHRALVVHQEWDLGVFARCYAALSLWLLGAPAQALAQVHEARTLAQDLADPFSLAYVLLHVTRLYQWRRDVSATLTWGEAVIALCAEHGFGQYVSHGRLLHGWALAAQGQADAGLAQMRQSLTAYEATGAAMWRPYFLAMLAEGYGQVGAANEGLQGLAEALAVVQCTGERVWEAELHRLQGELVLQTRHKLPVPQGSVAHATGHTPQPAAAEACFHQALAVARHQQAKSLELRAATSLAQLWQQQGKRDEARKLLAPVYGWFTEGFDTADLQEARALLETLAG